MVPGVYQTKQKDMISVCLASRPGKLLSAKEIHAICGQEGTPVGLVTIYRQLARLISEGKVKKIITNDNSGTRFGWLDTQGQKEAFLLKCDRCGRIVHVDCGLLEEVTAHMSEKHDFRIDAVKSVLYGRCKEC